MGWDETVVMFRRDLHQIPELGHEEFKTSEYIVRALTQMGLSAVRLTPTGVMADIEGHGPGKTVALRADMDGLPIQEETGLPFSSRHDGVMHACGHDGHMAILLACAGRLAEDRSFSGKVRVLFQPAEEKPPGGAPTMIEQGCLDGVDEVLGLHLWSSDPVGTAGIRAGATMANADAFQIMVHGRGGHGSEPEATQDAVVIASHIVMNLQTIVSRKIGAFEPAVVTCGTIRSGSTFNIIAETAEISGTVRTLSEEVQTFIESEIRQIADKTAAMYGARAAVEYFRGYPAVINHAESVMHWEQALEGLVTVFHPNPSMGGKTLPII